MLLAMDHKAIKVVIDREQAMDQEASERSGSNRWIGEKGTDQGGIVKSN